MNTNEKIRKNETRSLEKAFLRTKAGTAIARLSRRNSVCLSVTRVDRGSVQNSAS